MPPRAREHAAIIHPRRSSLLSLLLVTACAQGRCSGEVTNPDTAPRASAPAPRYEDVEFRRRSGAGSPTGAIEATLPDGRTFSGRFHAISETTQVADVSDLYASWRAEPWSDARWFWGDTWPRLNSVEEFIINYSGKVVATLTSRDGTKMRCRFVLDAPGTASGGVGECQIASGQRITAKLPPM